MSNKKLVIKMCMSIMFLAFSVMIFVGCTFGKHFFDYSVIWYCEDPKIEFSAQPGIFSFDDIICIDEITYSIDTTASNNGDTLYIYNSKFEEHNDETLIWECQTKISNEDLYMTIVKDNVSGYEGKTIVLKQRPIETI